MTHGELIIRGINWIKNNQISARRCPIILPEYKCYANSIPDVIGMSHTQTTVIECKVSRQDYFADQKKHHRQFLYQLGNYRYYLCPVDLIKVNEVNNGWGLLYCHEHRISVEKESDYFSPEDTRKEEYQVLYSVIRRLTAENGHDKMLKMLRGKQ